jgi:hypothetical protein
MLTIVHIGSPKAVLRLGTDLGIWVIEEGENGWQAHGA